MPIRTEAPPTKGDCTKRVPPTGIAGANNGLYLIRNHELIQVKPDKQPIGNYQDQKPFTLHEYDLDKGDVIYLFSDGYPDQFGGPKGKKFMYSKFRKLIFNLKRH